MKILSDLIEKLNNETLRWKLISVLLGIFLLAYSITWRERIETMTLIKCEALLYEKYHDILGNIKNETIPINQINLTLNNSSVIK